MDGVVGVELRARRAGALREPFELSWERMLRFAADGLGIDLDEKTSL